MFDSLKKRLKEALTKATSTISKKIEEEKPKEEAKAPLPEQQAQLKPEHIEEKEITHVKEEQKSKIVTKEKELQKEAEEIKKTVEKDVKEIEERIERVEELQEEVKPAEPEKKSILGRLFKRVAEKKLGENDIEPVLKELNKALLENDVALETTERICADVKSNLMGKGVSRGRVEDAIKDALRIALLDVMNQDKVNLEQEIEKRWTESNKPYLVMFFGFNGVGKTTSISKFAYRFKNYSPVIAAGDTFRAASIEQLEEHSRRLGADLVKHKYGADSAAVIFDAVKHASAKNGRLVLADTAGRSHSNVNLMDELKKVVRVNKPDLKILVLDSLTGNDIYEQSRLFNEAVGVDGIILTKADVYQKGGAALSAAHTIKKPILFLGVGQNYEDLKEFVPEEVVKGLLE